jgi:TonB-dependent starch-binding outer membrane protein SusC
MRLKKYSYHCNLFSQQILISNLKSMKRKHVRGFLPYFVFAVIMALSTGAWAQQRTIRGTVTDDTGSPLPGVTVVVQGTTTGTVTNVDGGYQLDVPASANTLVFSYIGMLRQPVQIGNQTSINVTMQPDVIGVDEVVVVGYGTRMREELTGAVSSVSNEKLQVSTAPSVVSRMQGQVSGVTITQANRPGGDATIRVRGIGTITNSNPLFVIDGVPAGPGNNLNPNDIESISVLKDASSAAIYGTRGANGVVIITTKRGRVNQAPNVNLSVRTGVSNATNQYDMLNTPEYAEAVWLSFKNRGVAPAHAQYGSGASPVIPNYILPAGASTVNLDLYKYPDFQIFEANKQGTNWYDEIYQTALIQEYDLSVSGGGNNGNYAFSGSYLDEDGFLKHTNFKRWTFRMNADAKVNDWFKVGESLQVIYINEFGDLGDNGEGTPISQAYRTQPIIPVYDIAGNFAGSKANEMGNSGNPLAQLYRAKDNNGKWNRILGNAYAELTPISGITLRSLLGYNWGQWNGKYHIIPNFEHSEPNRVNGLDVSSNFNLQWNWTNTLGYNAEIIPGQRLNVILGTEAVENFYRYLNASRRNYFSQDPNYMQLDSGESNKENSGNTSDWALFSQFARLNYDISNKYYFEATVRRDGTSRTAVGQNYGVFPAASLAWTISEENFMAGTDWLDLFKIRLGWGMTGNDLGMGLYNSYTTFRSDPYRSSYAIGGSNTSAQSGFMPSALGNPDVKWEATTTYNLGFDGRMFDNKMRFALDVWQRFTSDMLFVKPIPHVVGVVSAPAINIAEMENKGFDLELGYNNRSADGRFTYSLTATVSRYTNKITDLTGDPDLLLDGANQRQMVYTRFGVGTAYPEFYGYIVDGIFQTEAEAAQHPQYETTNYNQPGHYKYRDISGPDGEPDGKITADDRTFIGSPHPDFVGGLNMDFTFANFDLNMFWYGSYGNEVVNYVTRWIDYGMFNGGLSKRALYETWGSPYLNGDNTRASLPKLDQNDISQRPSTAFLEDGSYLRLKNLRLGYTIPGSVLERAQIKRLALYVQVTNLITFTKYSGLDPEINLSGVNMGLDMGAWPTPRQVMFGINLGL